MARLDKDGWEESDFPIVCETCLGDNPYVRMTKERFGQACKICSRPFTIFRWKPGTNARYKKVEICQTCAKQKNVCQVCVLDLEYGLPVQVRDTLVGKASAPPEVPSHPVNREFFVQQQTKAGAMDTGVDTTSHADLLARLARAKPQYKRNAPHICSFFVRGACKRGAFCPYLHELPNPDPEMAKQNIKDRFYGKDDPVAKKILARARDISTGAAADPYAEPAAAATMRPPPPDDLPGADGSGAASIAAAAAAAVAPLHGTRP